MELFPDVVVVLNEELVLRVDREGVDGSGLDFLEEVPSAFDLFLALEDLAPETVQSSAIWSRQDLVPGQWSSRTDVSSILRLAAFSTSFFSFDKLFSYSSIRSTESDGLPLSSLECISSLISRLPTQKKCNL